MIFSREKRKEKNGNILGHLQPSPLHLIFSSPLSLRRTCKNLQTFLMHISNFPPFFHQVQHFPPLFPIFRTFFCFFLFEKRRLFFSGKKCKWLLPQDADFFPVWFILRKDRVWFGFVLGFFFSLKYRFLKSVFWTLTLFDFCWANRRKLANF